MIIFPRNWIWARKNREQRREQPLSLTSHHPSPVISTRNKRRMEKGGYSWFTSVLLVFVRSNKRGVVGGYVVDLALLLLIRAVFSSHITYKPVWTCGHVFGAGVFGIRVEKFMEISRKWV